MKLNCNYIKELRLTSFNKNGEKLSREELSYLVDVSSTTIQLMEGREDFNPGILTVVKLSNYFNVSLDSFITS